MTLPGGAYAHSDSHLDEVLQETDDIESIGRLFAGCVAYLDHADGSMEMTWSHSP